MRYILPNISINILPNQIKEIRKIASNSNFKVSIKHQKNSNEIERLIFEPLSKSIKQVGLIGQIIIDQTNRIRISLNAREWKRNPPTYEEYADAAGDIFNEILQSYNDKYKKLLRLKIDPKRTYIDTLPPKSKAAFHHFIKIRNQYAEISESDYGRFYEFIRICHETRVKKSATEIYWLLLEEKLYDEEAKELSNIYYHIRQYLKRNFIIFNSYGTNYKEYILSNNL